jgi:hypothetical protein
MTIEDWAEVFRDRWARRGPRVARHSRSQCWCAEHAGVWILGIPIAGARDERMVRGQLEGAAFRPLLEQCPADVLRIVMFEPGTDSMILFWHLVDPTYVVQGGRLAATGAPPVRFPPPTD